MWGLGFACLSGLFAAWLYFAGKELGAGAELPGLHLAEELLLWRGQGDCLGFAAWSEG